MLGRSECATHATFPSCRLLSLSNVERRTARHLKSLIQQKRVSKPPLLKETLMPFHFQQLPRLRGDLLGNDGQSQQRSRK